MAVEPWAHSSPVKALRFLYVLRLTWIPPTSKIHHIWTSLTKSRDVSKHKKSPVEPPVRRQSDEYDFVNPYDDFLDNGGAQASRDENIHILPPDEAKETTTNSRGTQTTLKSAEISLLQAERSNPPFPPFPPPPPPLPPSSPPSCRRCLNLAKVQRELARLRTELLTTRAHVQNELRVLTQMREFALKAQESVIEAVNTAIERGTLAEDQAEIQRLQQEVLRLNRDLHDQAEHSKILQRRLSSLDYRFGQKEEELYPAALCDELTDERLEDSESVSSSSTESSIDNAPTLVREFYDCVGAMDATWHTLQEIEEEHREDLRERARSAADGHSLVPSEKEFFRDFFEERAKIVERYLQEKTEAKRLREQCVKRNYQIRDHGLTETPPLGTYATVRPIELLLFRPSNQEERLREWLEDVLREQTTVTYRFPFWDARGSESGLGQEKNLEQEPQIFQGQTTQDPVHPPLPTELDVPESSRGLSGPAMPRIWPGEILLRRYSNPDLSHKHRLDSTIKLEPSSRSMC